MTFDRMRDRMEDRELRRARTLLVVVGVAAVAVALLQYSELSHLRSLLQRAGELGSDEPTADALLRKVDHFMYVPICSGLVGLAFLVCGALVRRKPVVTTRAAVALYAANLLVAFAVLGAEATVGGLFENAAIMAGLVSAAIFAQVYERGQQAKEALPTAKVV